jgi:hypothetical protein
MQREQQFPVTLRPRGKHAVAYATAMLVIAWCGGCLAADEPSELDGESIVGAAWAAFEEQARAEAIESVVMKSAAAAESSRLDRMRTFGPLLEADRQNLAAVLDHSLSRATAQIRADTDKTRRFIETEFLPEWAKAERAVLESARLADESERELRKAQQTALALGAENRWFWLASLIALAALLAVFGVDQRHAIRRYLNGGRAKGLGLGRVLVAVFLLLCCVTAGLFVVSDGLIVDLLAPGPVGSGVVAVTAVHQADQDLLREGSARRAALDASAATEKRNVAELFHANIPPAQAGELLAHWWEYWDAVADRTTQRAALESARSRLASAVAALNPDQVESIAGRVKSRREQAAGWRRHARLICGFIGIGLVSLVALGFGGLVRMIRRRSWTLANTCPLCLSEGTLKPVGDEAEAGMVRCGHVISESPFEECDFEFPTMFRDVAKLCFPTLGVPSAGKTHWLAMVYRQLNQGDFPGDVEFAKLRSRSADDFDHVIEDMLASKRGPAATQQNALPKPLVFNFIDRDRLSRSNILVNVFDYSGEVLRSFTLEDHQRRRAFTADGYFFFLDPTKTSDEQTKSLNDFRQDVRIVKKLRAGQQIRCPVALCVPKIDLLTSQPYADPKGGDAVDHFYRDLSEIGWGHDEASIARRSGLMRSLRDTIWPGWEIERQIDDLFGGRYMFFPFTPVGLDGMGEDWTAGNRMISPVGILNPLLWLLHMNGYPVLPGRASP